MSFIRKEEKEKMMKNFYIFLIILGIVIIIFAGYFGYATIRDNSECSVFNPEKCKNQCSNNSDCMHACGCGCVNKNETCNTCKRVFLMGECMSPSCVQVNCSCVNNQCTRQEEK